MLFIKHQMGNFVYELTELQKEMNF
jgi:hypothetical protein